MPNIRQKKIAKLKPHPHTVELLKEELIKNGGLKITGFGMFKIRITKGAKNGFNPYSQKRQRFPSKVKILFKPVKSFNDKLQKCKN